MKISTFLKVATLAAIPIVVTSCGGKATDKSSDAADSIIQKQADENGFFSPDLAMENLKGQVKSVTETTYGVDEQGEVIDDGDPETITTNFSPEGQILNYHGIDFAKDSKLISPLIHRNNKGQLASYKCNEDDIEGYSYDDEVVIGEDNLSFDEKGRKLKLEYTGYEWTGTTTWEYDDKGDTALEESNYSDEGETGLRRVRYTIEKRDSNGNWTEASVSVETIWSEEDGGPDDVNRDIYGTKVVRKIEYYK